MAPPLLMLMVLAEGISVVAQEPTPAPESTPAPSTNSSSVVPHPKPTDCTLVALALRFQNKPIDLEPPFRPYISEYVATLDFSMSTYSVLARPDTGCDVDGVPALPETVQIGGEKTLTLHARNTETQENKEYVVTIKRLLGSETDLQLLRVEDSALSPVFDPNNRHYHVKLGLGCDEARVVYKLRDNSQRIRSHASKETPQGMKPTSAPSLSPGGSNDTNSSGGSDSGDEGGSSSGDEPSKRRLSGDPGLVADPRRLTSEVQSGEVQFSEDYVSFMVDVGFSRTVTLTVQCADATQADIRTYTLELTRPGCTPERPYFNPRKSYCVSFCPSGYYKNPVMNRCAECNQNCEVCDSLLVCKMCKPDTPDYEYVVQADGSCRAYANHIFKKYKLWCIGLGVLLLFLVLIGCAGICQLCCIAGESNKGNYKKFRTYSDSDEETQQFMARRPLAKY